MVQSRRRVDYRTDGTRVHQKQSLDDDDYDDGEDVESGIEHIISPSSSISQQQSNYECWQGEIPDEPPYVAEVCQGVFVQ